MRAADLTPEDAMSRELKNDDSLKESDQRECTGQPLLRLGKVPTKLKPNSKKEDIYFGKNEKKLLPTAYTAEPHKRTLDQMPNAL